MSREDERVFGAARVKPPVMSTEQGERCPVCEGLDQPGLLHNVNAPYCSASTEQGNVEVIREALQRYGHLLPTDAFNELRRNCHAVAAALERAERGQQECERQYQAKINDLLAEMTRAEKAERALAEALDAVIWLTGFGDLTGNPEWARIRDERIPEWRAALRPSEDTSDES